ncbi:MAG: DUF763 domain-containing protein [Betaproteobacteria bacterium]|nr:MAG: DUF763 domain-containing protein [Betaproteobacteria bacterium]
MSRTGLAHLPLHGGKAPRYLFERMVPLSREIVIFLASEFGRHEVLRRLSDPYWFQAFGCVLGFDWHSSGLTTTVCGALKEGLRGTENELGIFVAGGKGATSRKTPAEISAACERIGHDPDPLIYASRISAKVDNSAVQDGYQLYHHSFVFTADGQWCIVQQGMSDATSTARRYHWLSDSASDYVSEPHAAICCDANADTLNLVAMESADVRSASAALAAQKPEVILNALGHLPLLEMPRRHEVARSDINPKYLERILLRTYETAPADFESLLAIEGVGAKTLRALALTAELIYGTRASRRDPARYSFAHGGKDGTPFPVDRTTYDKTIEVMHHALNGAKIDRSEKIRAFRRLAEFSIGDRAADRSRAEEPGFSFTGDGEAQGLRETSEGGRP